DLRCAAKFCSASLDKGCELLDDRGTVGDRSCGGPSDRISGHRDGTHCGGRYLYADTNFFIAHRLLNLVEGKRPCAWHCFTRDFRHPVLPLSTRTRPQPKL